ncbi:uncharacterized protein N7506_012286 [Penicillium brevicompactum]|uniref:uncharacterized protein n=1 Tax=Penicillium brevicompactum TaxID=5074 RepID=UPI002540B140|nr:uncharacterized protein N7506_012286 [Penicillium brevicompactum]KAJ5319582.1 hypothetical protein N7506_012286 [Penicillium brevicompactum]
MGDPFSIASGTVGIISLGIQLCKEITTYVDSWRGYDADLESIGWKAESLKEPLKQLRDFVEDTQVTDPNTANDITDKASELKRHLTRLEKRLTEAKPVISSSLTDKFRNKLKKAAYPVRARDALRDIKDDLESVQSIIEFALTIFTAKRTQKASQSTERTLKLVEEIHVTLSTIPQNIMLPPSVLKSLCDRCEEHANLADLNSQSNPTTQGDDFDLNIDARLSSMTLSTKRARREDSAKKLFRYYSGWLARQITFSFSLSYSAGAFSIAPVLEVQAYRGPGSWVENAVSLERLRRIWMMQDPNSLRESENEIIGDFQQAISKGKFEPGDIHEDGGSIVERTVSIVNSIGYRTGKLEPRVRLTKFLRFMIECGYNLKLDDPQYMMFNVLNAKWGANDEMFALYLINHGAIVKHLPRTRHGKENIRRLLCRDTELADLPELAKKILLESELKLRKALQSGNTNLTNGNVGHPSFLELAVGWPGGVRVLLEFGAEASEVTLRMCPYRTIDTDDSDCDDYCDSIMPLLQGGCNFEAYDICMCKSKKARLLLIKEYANRRKILLGLARSRLPPESFAEILGDSSSESIFDVHVPQICTELINNGQPLHRSMRYESKNYQPLYHSCLCDLDAWDDLYRAGFRDIDIPGYRELTPLMSCALDYEFQRNLLAWLVDKGASMLKRLPFSDTTIAHRVSSRFADHLLSAIISDKSFSKIPHRTQVSLEWAKKRKGSIVLIPSVQDCCVCACCHGGCTTLSVALRSCNKSLGYQSSRGNPRAEYLWLLNSLIDLTETTLERDHSIIRFLTFEALGLRHTCCVTIDHAFARDYRDFVIDKEEVQNIQDEDKHRYKQLDQLVGKFDTWFDELELPIVEFLSGPWHSHMVEVLSTRDSYDEEHVRQTRDLGIFLEPVDFDEIPQFVYYLGHQVEELESEVAV